MNYISKGLLIISIFSVEFAVAQERHDKGEFIKAENKFYDEIQKNIELFNAASPEKPPVFKMDFSTVDAPKSANEFKTVWTGKPVSQGMTNTCWSFSTTSFFESEVKRISGNEVRLSELYIVYFEYIEKAKEFVKTRGASFFGEGSESNAVTRMMKQYGIVPYESYTGYRIGQKFLDHSVMFKEMESYLKNIKSTGAWNENEVVGTIKSIMDFYMGKVPEFVVVNGKKLTPVEYMNTVLKIHPEEYVEFMSLKAKPYWQKAEYDVPDNWWNSDDYYNVPLDDFMNIVKSSIKSGYSLAIGGDVSESGILGSKGIAVIPTYDIPSAFIDENARQMRFSNGSTTDDHGVHLVGWVEKPSGTWFLIKDSGSGAHNNPNSPGFYYYHEDYVKLKMMSFTVHRDAVKDILQKVPNKK
ncbi:MAG TPA: C1 family peptidase [Bacteroidia bacterium]|nr:C1 family peptidase [Bacteroidia bacterium]